MARTKTQGKRYVNTSVPRIYQLLQKYDRGVRKNHKTPYRPHQEGRKVPVGRSLETSLSIDKG